MQGFMALKVAAGAIVGAVGLGLIQDASAENWPSRSVRIVVPFAAGGTTDVAARIIAQQLQQSTGQPFVVDNRPGASGMIGSEYVARSTPDGYTLVMGSSSTKGSTKYLYSKLPYDPVRDFTPVSLVATSQSFLVVHPSVPATSVAELLQYIKQNPGKVNYSSAGIGTYHHMAGALLASMSGGEMTHVPYQGGGPAFAALVGGQVQMMVATISEVGAYIDSDQCRVLAIIAPERSPSRPDLPSITEELPDFEVPLWVGLLAPANTPSELVSRISKAVADAVNQEAVSKKLVGLGFNPVGNSPEEYAKVLQSDLQKWPAIIKVSGAKFE